MAHLANPSRAIRAWALALYWISIFLLTHWPEIDRYEPTEGWPIPYFYTMMHFSTYGGLAVMWWWLLSVGGKGVTYGTSAWLVLGIATYSILDEWSQSLVGRHPNVNDFLTDVVGVLVVVAICHIWQRLRGMHA